jgi:hypothetical protein
VEQDARQLAAFALTSGAVSISDLHVEGRRALGFARDRAAVKVLLQNAEGYGVAVGHYDTAGHGCVGTAPAVAAKIAGRAVRARRLVIGGDESTSATIGVVDGDHFDGMANSVDTETAP